MCYLCIWPLFCPALFGILTPLLGATVKFRFIMMLNTCSQPKIEHNICLDCAEMQDGRDEDETFSDWSDAEDAVLSLFAQLSCTSGAEALAHDKQHYGFDLAQLKQELSLDMYGLIKVELRLLHISPAAGQPLVSLLL